ncbi:MAG TPA: hypothetical protein VG755_35415 [Nannocystaceae bacterium]|nr:hypothetical protein [Nannocystaceae bacterium]
MTCRDASFVALLVLGAGCFAPTHTDGQNESEGSGTGDTTGTSATTASTSATTATSTSATTATTASDATDPGTETTDAPDTGSTMSEEESGDPGCPAPNVCVDAAPEGWSGPAVLFRGDAAGRPPVCASPYPVHELDGFGDLDVPAGTCDCDCTPPDDAHCDGGSVIYNVSDATCNTTDTIFTISDGCAEFGGEYFSVRYFEFDASDVQVFGSDCEPVAQENIPPATHQSLVLACGGASEAGTCATGVCVPEPASPFQDRLCIWQDGDVECPADTGYTAKEVAFDSLTDDRECSTCSCGALGGSCGAPTVTLRADNGCNGTAGITLDDGECGQAGVAANSAELTAAVDPSCTPAGGELGGEVTENGAHTICCTR